MNISFTLNQAEALALSESRYNEIYFLMRSYTGLEVGVFADADWLNAALHTQLSSYIEDNGIECWHIRGQSFDRHTVMHCISVRKALVSVKVYLGFVKNHNGSVSELAKAVKELKKLLSNVEW